MEIEWSPEDATNSEYLFLLSCIRIAISSGANIINVPDTV
jgi:2-isopropylmalate synthase